MALLERLSHVSCCLLRIGIVMLQLCCGHSSQCLLSLVGVSDIVGHQRVADTQIIDMSAAVSSWTLRYFGFDDCVASCKSANTHLFGLDVFTVHVYIASKLSSSESSACILCGDFVNANTAVTSSIVFTFVLCGFVRHLLVKCPYF